MTQDTYRSLLGPSAAAEYLDIPLPTFKSWIRQGHLTPTITTPNGTGRFSRSDLDAFAASLRGAK